VGVAVAGGGAVGKACPATAVAFGGVGGGVSKAGSAVGASVGSAGLTLQAVAARSKNMMTMIDQTMTKNEFPVWSR
jgi:hypothetical protein